MTDKLSRYKQKRNFEKTSEPEGAQAGSEERLRFAVQHHMARREHYDLRLEWGGVLLSWAVPKGPSYNTRDKRLAVRVEDHPLDYRNFEGMIPKGQYGGGIVMLWDEGYWEPLGNVEEGLRKGELKFLLSGRRLKGRWVLVRWNAKSDKEKDNWIWIKERDEFVQAADGISEFSTSIRTGRTMAEIEAGDEEKLAKNPFNKAEVQLAKRVDAIPADENWLYELKYDGYRIMAFVEGNGVRLITRNGHDYASRFPTVASTLADLAAGRAMVLDGEMTMTDEAGKSDFQALQSYLKNSKAGNLTYIVFDLLALDGMDIRKHPLTERKERLEALMKNAPRSLYFSRHIRGSGKESFAAACKAGMEGIIGKKPDSVYSGARNGDWIKLKCENRQEFVIGGYSLSDKKTSGISSLLLGVYEEDELIYAGRVGTGMSEADMKALRALFEKLERPNSSFSFPPKPRGKEKLTWLDPELSAEIKFAEWTKDHLIRQGSFKGIRSDKNPMVNKREIEGVKISNPDKVLFDDPPITKEDVVRYYEKISERMLPFASRRILSIVRCPKGVSQTCFYKKHPDKDKAGIVNIPITTPSGKTELYFYLENATGLLSEAQMGTLEFHIWGSRVDELEKPDMMVFDLDPDEGLGLEKVRQGARDVRSILRELSLEAYLKTSGGKGYHVVVPMKPVMEWGAFHDFARRVAEVMEQKWPDRYTSNVRKANRAGKIFIDWIRNGRGATSIAPYSLRARKGAKVSMPISWEELDSIAPDGIHLADALKRLGGDDPWKHFFEI
ncbi:DNA ligase D [Paenibacillus sp. HB172176]|uniref:DNA ligase D n=1 Tax=Paenibacillus sp. HB172176 TaxID=2493690 RepID=UPI001439819B|nr:DNA ligase D [Paenibacillus sp. HB172176]